MSFGSEFKAFILRGNLTEIAIGFTVGAAFTTVAKSLVSDIIMPVVGLAIGSVDFKDMFLVLSPRPPAVYPTLEAAQKAGAVTLNYGLFINSLIALLLVALVMFMLVRMINRLHDVKDGISKNAEKIPEPANKTCPYCCSSIADQATRCPNCTSELKAPSKL